MRVHAIEQAFGLENLKPGKRPDPEPGPGEIRVRLGAASLNYRDLLMVRGHYDPRQPLPLVPCSDGAGVVDALGPGVTRWKEGDRVIPCFHQGWSGGELTRELGSETLGGRLDGTLAEAVVVRADSVVPTPEYLSDEEAATLPCAALTAWSALFGPGSGVRAGDTVLVQGTGGVSTFALQLAHAAGCRVIVTSSSPAKLARARELGAEHGVNYAEDPDWEREVKEVSGGGVDLVVEVGGAGTLAKSLRAVRMGGTIAMIGVLSGVKSELELTAVLMRRVRIQGILVGSREEFLAMNKALEAHQIRPVIDRVFDLSQARNAFEHLAEAGHQGKVVVRTQPS